MKVSKLRRRTGASIGPAHRAGNLAAQGVLDLVGGADVVAGHVGDDRRFADRRRGSGRVRRRTPRPSRVIRLQWKGAPTWRGTTRSAPASFASRGGARHRLASPEMTVCSGAVVVGRLHHARTFVARGPADGVDLVRGQAHDRRHRARGPLVDRRHQLAAPPHEAQRVLEAEHPGAGSAEYSPRLCPAAACGSPPSIAARRGRHARPGRSPAGCSRLDELILRPVEAEIGDPEAQDLIGRAEVPLH